MATLPKKMDGRTAALTALALVLLVTLAVAWRIDAEATTTPPGAVYTLSIIDESGAPITSATIVSGDREWTPDETGTISAELSSPALYVATADGMIPDAVVLGSLQTPHITLTLLSRHGPGGDRTVMHFGGDFMMGRRYLEPSSDRTPVVTDEASARAVVADVAPLFELADLVSVNYESVAGTLSPDDAYPGKKYLLQSPPETLAALEELGVDVATLGNNHIIDWLEAGVVSTIRNLDAAGIALTGGGTTAEEAIQPAIIDTGFARVGVVSMTTTSGDYVNDSLPGSTAPAPASLAEENRWQYEARRFGFGAEGDDGHIPVADRRPGEMWSVFSELEERLSAGDAADIWMEIARVYPELQDTVARRGHGGAAHFSREAVQASISAARSDGADLVVVQIHGGLPFAKVGSEYFRTAARISVDAGADLVIGHHPHVLQGFEYYDDTLIAHSLANFVFDQDFLVTHPSVVLRTVFEGADLVEAKLYPIMIDSYRPVPVGGSIADMILDKANEASLQSAHSLRFPDRRIGSASTPIEPTAEVVKTAGQGMIVPIGSTVEQSMDLVAGIPVAPAASLASLGGDLRGVQIGRDLFGFGDLEDVQADDRGRGGLEWVLPGDSLEVDDRSPSGPWVIRLDRTSQHLDDVYARTAARIPLPRHRWFDEEGAPVDGEAGYSVRVWAKRVGAGIPFVRVSFYEFDDTDPTRKPQSTALETVDLPLPLVNNDTWHEIWIDLPEPPEDGNAALVGVGLAPPESRSGTVWVDGLEIVEWRPAAMNPEGAWTRVDYLLATEDRTVTLTVADRQ